MRLHQLGNTKLEFKKRDDFIGENIKQINYDVTWCLTGMIHGGETVDTQHRTSVHPSMWRKAGEYKGCVRISEWVRNQVAAAHRGGSQSHGRPGPWRRPHTASGCTETDTAGSRLCSPLCPPAHTTFNWHWAGPLVTTENWLVLQAGAADWWYHRIIRHGGGIAHWYWWLVVLQAGTTDRYH